jgi:DNA-directed RNA polymerase sigma subunit (sigma70/sigma32)
MTMKNCANPTSLDDEKPAEIVAETERWLEDLDLDDPNVEITYTPLAASFLRVGEAMRNVETAEHELVEAVRALHEAGYSWTVIGKVLGVSRQAARQRFGVARSA